MNASSSSSKTGNGRRVLVAVSIATMAAAVTAGVALNHRHHANAIQESSSQASPAPLVANPPSDPSLPAESEVLQRVPDGAADPPPSF